MLLTITVKYSCFDCFLTNVEVIVPAREPDEDVVRFMNQTIEHIGRDHHRRSPQCRPQELKNLMIPIEGDVVGGAKRH